MSFYLKDFKFKYFAQGDFSLSYHDFNLENSLNL